MDSETMVRVIAGICFVCVLAFMILRRRKKVS